ncbi:MAG: Adaptive-response sensory-kinase SasA [Phycisphaerae bacterium]|nr:Adaptive-response sensory-kinase SasA [Phycisphaerae bacterium]
MRQPDPCAASRAFPDARHLLPLLAAWVGCALLCERVVSAWLPDGLMVFVAPAQRSALEYEARRAVWGIVATTALATGLVVVAGLVQMRRVAMALTRAERELSEELRAARQRDESLRAANQRLEREVQERQAAQGALAAADDRLIEASRHAGMAEVATGVLHNVGNVLNSVTVSANLLIERLSASRLIGLERAMELFRQHSADLTAYLRDDSRGRKLPEYMERVTRLLAREQRENLGELSLLTRYVDHVREVINMQQSYAGKAGVEEVIRVADLLDDAVRMNAASLLAHGIALERDVDADEPLLLDKHRLLQVLVNLIGNAKYAVLELRPSGGRITLRARITAAQRLRIEVTDNGVGISRENLTRIFSCGFTTKKHGHGFGLHSGALAVREMGGSLSVHSDGPGRGATFAIDLPAKRVEATA